MEKIKWSENDVSHQSSNKLEFARYQIAHVMEYLTDPRSSERLKLRECSYCYYLNSSRLAGQAFTEWACRVCNQESMHSNTYTPKICISCAHTHSLCVICGADVHLRVRRKSTLDQDSTK